MYYCTYVRLICVCVLMWPHCGRNRLHSASIQADDERLPLFDSERRRQALLAVAAAAARQAGSGAKVPECFRLPL